MRLSILVATEIKQPGIDGIVTPMKPVHEVGINPEIGVRSAYPPSFYQSERIRGIAQIENLADECLDFIDCDIKEKVRVPTGKPGHHGQRILPR
jgi:hypothetical protein